MRGNQPPPTGPPAITSGTPNGAPAAPSAAGPVELPGGQPRGPLRGPSFLFAQKGWRKTRQRASPFGNPPPWRGACAVVTRDRDAICRRLRFRGAASRKPGRPLAQNRQGVPTVALLLRLPVRSCCGYVNLAEMATSGSPETERTLLRRADFAPTTKRPRFRTTAVCSILDATIITPPAGDFISTLSRFFLTVSHIRTNLPERPEPFGQTITFVSAISAKAPS